ESGVRDAVARGEELVPLVPEADHAAEEGELRPSRGRQLREVVVRQQPALHEQERGVRVPEDVGELRRLVPGVERDEDGSGEGHPVGRGHPLGPVAHEQRDTRALPHARREQRLRHPRRVVGQARVAPAQHRAGDPVGVERDRLAIGVAGGHLAQEASEGERADARLARQRRPPERGHAASWISTLPLAITDPSWFVITRSTSTRPAPTVASKRFAATTPSTNVTSPSNGGKRYWMFEWRTKPRSPAQWPA